MPGQVVKTNAGSLALRYRRRSKALQAGLVDAVRESAKDAQKVAVSYSSARAYNPKRNKTRPYAKRNPHPPLPPFLVNVQSGEFRKGWKTRAQKTHNGAVGTLYNAVEYANKFNGKPSRHMIARPILQEVRKAAGPNYRKRMRQAVRSALSKR